MRFIATGSDYRHSHPGFLHFLKRKIIQFRPYSIILIFRMDYKKLNFTCLVIVV